jgi:hypothetical protein
MERPWDEFTDYQSRDWRLLLATKLWLRAQHQPGLTDAERENLMRHSRGLEAIHKRLEAQGRLPKGPPAPHQPSLPNAR